MVDRSFPAETAPVRGSLSSWRRCPIPGSVSRADVFSEQGGPAGWCEIGEDGVFQGGHEGWTQVSARVGKCFSFEITHRL